MKKIDGETLQHFRLDNIQVNKVQREIKKYNMTKAEFYRMQVEEGIIKPAEKLAEHLERSNDKFSHAQLKMPEKGRERK